MVWVVNGRMLGRRLRVVRLRPLKSAEGPRLQLLCWTPRKIFLQRPAAEAPFRVLVSRANLQIQEAIHRPLERVLQFTAQGARRGYQYHFDVHMRYLVL